MHCSPPGFSVRGISQARLLEWVAISFSRRSSQPRDQTCVSCTGRRVLYTEPPGKPIIYIKCIETFSCVYLVHKVCVFKATGMIFFIQYITTIKKKLKRMPRHQAVFRWRVYTNMCITCPGISEPVDI